MTTRIPDNSLCTAATAGHTEAFPKAGYSLPRQATPRKNADDERSDDDGAAGTNSQKTPVSDEDARHFEAAMRSDERRSDSRQGNSSADQDADSQEKEPHEEDKSGEQSFASLFVGRFEAGAVADPVKTQAASSAASTQRVETGAEALAQHLAERILVSESSAAGQEVRIQLAGNILPDTEICLLRGTDGLLSAVIRTDNPAAFQTLAAAQHDLRNRLEASEGQTVHVELRSGADDDNDPRRRSRGLDVDPHA